jgi:hypothetical protein
VTALERTVSLNIDLLLVTQLESLQSVDGSKEENSCAKIICKSFGMREIKVMHILITKRLIPTVKQTNTNMHELLLFCKQRMQLSN